jgi:hypothetical protein
MNILAAIKREEKKLEKQMSELQHKLNGVRSAAKALGHTAAVEVKGERKRVESCIPFVVFLDSEASIPASSHV